MRLLGAVVAVTLAVIFVPMFFESGSLDTPPAIQETMPRPPAFDPSIKTEVFLKPGDAVPGPLSESVATVSKPLPLPPASDAGTAASGAQTDRDPAGTAAGTAGPAPAVRPAPAKSAGASGEPAAAKPGKGSSPAQVANGALPSWVVQVASVPSAAGAAELEGKLRAGGFPAFVEKADVNGKTTYRVRVGPELDRARAEQTAARLREKHKVATLITSYP
jgi:DedD protein